MQTSHLFFFHRLHYYWHPQFHTVIYILGICESLQFSWLFLSYSHQNAKDKKYCKEANPREAAWCDWHNNSGHYLWLNSVATSFEGCIWTKLSHFEGSFKCGRQLRPSNPQKRRLQWAAPSGPNLPTIHCTSVTNHFSKKVMALAGNETSDVWLSGVTSTE